MSTKTDIHAQIMQLKVIETNMSTTEKQQLSSK